MESILKSLKKALILKNLPDFQKTLESVNFDSISEINFTKISAAMMESYKTFDYIDPHYKQTLKKFVKNSESWDFLFNLCLFKTCFELEKDLFPESINCLSKCLTKMHPLEMSSFSSIEILSILNTELWYPDNICKFIGQSVLFSSFPAGKLSQELSCSLVWSFVESKNYDTDIWKLLIDQVLPLKFHRFSYEHRIDLIHALSLKENFCIPADILEVFFAINFKNLSLFTIFQAYQVFAYLKIFKGVEYHKKYFEIGKNIENLKKTNDWNEKKPFILSSKLHIDIENNLKTLGFSPISEYELWEPYNIIVDLFIYPDIIIEAQGPNHYTKPSLRVSTRTEAKLETLRMLGYKVKTIPYFEWDLLNAKEKKDYLSNLLN